MKIQIGKILGEIQDYSILLEDLDQDMEELDEAYEGLGRLDDYSSGYEVINRLDEARDSLKRLLKRGTVSSLHVRLILGSIQDLREDLQETEEIL